MKKAERIVVRADYCAAYLAEFQRCMAATEITDSEGRLLAIEAGFDRLCSLSSSTREKDGQQFICGNGASAAFANHMALDWTKNGGVRTHAFANAALLTALVNDLGENQIFAAPLRFYAKSRDILIVVSSSGNSPNIVTAIDEAERLGLKVVTFTGLKPNNRCRGRGTINIYVPAKTYGIVECAHQFWLHVWLDRFMGIGEWLVSVPQDMRVSDRNR